MTVNNDNQESPDNGRERLLEAYTGLREGCGRITIKRDVVSVAGQDAAKFLQGQMTQDISSLAEGGSTYSFLLRPDGRVVALVRVSRLLDDRFLIDTDHGWGDAVAERLHQFKIRTKVDIEQPQYHCVSLRGQLSNDVLGIGGTYPSNASSDRGNPHSGGSDGGSLHANSLYANDVDRLYVMGDGVIAIPLLWDEPLVGYDLFCDDPSALDRLVGDLPGYPSPEYSLDMAETLTEVLRIEAGLPAMGREIDSNTIPAYTSIMDKAVSLGKGCYVGQELVERIDSRGSHVPKRLCRLVERDGATPLSTLDLSAITSAAWSPGSRAYVCMGYVPRKINVGDIIVLQYTPIGRPDEDVNGGVPNTRINNPSAKDTVMDESLSGSTVGYFGNGCNPSELLGKVFEVV